MFLEGIKLVLIENVGKMMGMFVFLFVMNDEVLFDLVYYV